jgi:integrase
VGDPATSRIVPRRLGPELSSFRQRHPLLKGLGLETCGFHSLRHTYASIALQKGIDIVTVSRILGHASPAITSGVYSHFLPGREREAADANASASRIHAVVARWSLTRS